MDKKKRKRLERAGWRVGSAAEFLGMTSVEVQAVEMKLSLSTTSAKGTGTSVDQRRSPRAMTVRK